MKLYIKNMVCNRCIMVVENELRNLGLNPLQVTLGEAILDKDPSPSDKLRINDALLPLGFELIDDKRSRLIEQIKTHIVDLVHHKNGRLKTNLSDYLSEHLHHEYTYLSHLFSDIEGTTIEKFFIAQRIEKVKEWLVYDELSLGEIADKLHFSSTAHLSNQFKKVTGLTPGHFKKIREQKRKPLDQV